MDFSPRSLLVLHRTPHGKRAIRYTMVSVISTVCTIVVLTLVYGVFRLWTEVPSTLFANVVSTVPSYYLNRNWAWGKSGRSHLTKEVLPFWGVALAGISFSLVTSSFARKFGISHHLNHLDKTVVVLAANILAFGILWILKLLIFNKLFHIAPIDADLVEV